MSHYQIGSNLALNWCIGIFGITHAYQSWAWNLSFRGPHPRSTRNPYQFGVTYNPLWLSFLYNWAWVYTMEQLMHGPKITRVPLEMQTTFPHSLCYPWPGNANTSANHLRSSMKCKQRWRTSWDILCHDGVAHYVLSRFANGTQATLLPVTQDGNLCHLVLARVPAILICGSSKLPLPTCKVVVGSWQDDSEKTFPQEHCLPSDLRKGIGSGLDLRKQKRKNAQHTKRIIPQGCKCIVAHTSTAISVSSSSCLSVRCRDL